MSEGSRGAERLVLLDRSMDVVGQVPVERLPTVVEVHGHRLDRGPNPLEREVDERDVPHGTERLRPEARERAEARAAASRQDYPHDAVHARHPRARPRWGKITP
jgi:hypothetical protein